MLIVVLFLLILGIAALVAAVIIGTPPPAYPKHGTFGIGGLDGSVIAWACVAVCFLGLVLLFIDARLQRRRPLDTEEPDHTAGDELFGEHDVERDLMREN
jgi:membrane protein implicated in regulation of membrane protease activity